MRAESVDSVGTPLRHLRRTRRPLRASGGLKSNYCYFMMKFWETCVHSGHDASKVGARIRNNFGSKRCRHGSGLGHRQPYGVAQEHPRCNFVLSSRCLLERAGANDDENLLDDGNEARPWRRRGWRRQRPAERLKRKAPTSCRLLR